MLRRLSICPDRQPVTDRPELDNRRYQIISIEDLMKMPGAAIFGDISVFRHLDTN